MNEYERQCNAVHGLRRKLEEASKLHDEARKRAVLFDTSDHHPDVRRMVRMWAREALDMVNATSRAITEETEVMNKMAATAERCELFEEFKELPR